MQTLTERRPKFGRRMVHLRGLMGHRLAGYRAFCFRIGKLPWFDTNSGLAYVRFGLLSEILPHQRPNIGFVSMKGSVEAYVRFRIVRKILEQTWFESQNAKRSKLNLTVEFLPFVLTSSSTVVVRSVRIGVPLVTVLVRLLCLDRCVRGSSGIRRCNTRR